MWELYDLTRDFTQADDLARQEPERLAKMKELFLVEARANKAVPIGGGLWTRFHPEDRIATPYTNWQFDATTTRMPEFTAPGVGRQSNRVVIDLEVAQDASGVLYAIGGASGGVTLFLDNRRLVYEYNMIDPVETVEARHTCRREHRPVHRFLAGPNQRTRFHSQSDLGIAGRSRLLQVVTEMVSL